jgi:hypothetical protein
MCDRGGFKEPGTSGSYLIPATQEKEIRVTVQSQPWQIVHETLSQKNTSQKKGLVEWLKWYSSCLLILHNPYLACILQNL